MARQSRSNLKVAVQISEPPKTEKTKKNAKASSRRKSRRNNGTKKPKEGPQSSFADFLSPEEEKNLKKIAKSLVEPGKGVLDFGSVEDLVARFGALHLIYDEDSLMQYLNLFLGAGKKLSTYVSGWLMEEAMLQTKDSHRAKLFVHSVKLANMMLGIHVGSSTVELAGTQGECTTEGLDHLREDCCRIKEMRVDFACWKIFYSARSPSTPSSLAMLEGANTLARFAVVSQKEGLVPVVSVIVDHDPSRGVSHGERVTKEILGAVVKTLHDHHIYLEGMVLQVSLVDFEQHSPNMNGIINSAAATLRALTERLPPALAGVTIANSPHVDSLKTMSTALNVINKLPGKRPFPISFCFGHIIYQGILEIYVGRCLNVEMAEQALIDRVKLCSAATMGQIPSWNQCLFITNVSIY